jgi:hypothetical protein
MGGFAFLKNYYPGFAQKQPTRLLYIGNLAMHSIPFHSLIHFLLSILLIFPNFEAGSDFALSQELCLDIFF